VGKTVLLKSNTVNLLERVSTTLKGGKNRNSLPFRTIKGSALGLGLGGRATNAAKSEQSLSREFVDGVRELRRNWSAWRTALELVYGRINGNYFSPHNRHIIKMYVTWCLKAVCMGTRAAAKQFSNKCRERAILTDNKRHNGFEVRAASRRKLFIASCLSRGVAVRTPPTEEVEAEYAAALDRLTEEHPEVDPRLLMDLQAFIKQQFGRRQPPAHYRNLPLPNGSACLELPRSHGGSKVAMTLYGRTEDANEEARKIQAQMDELVDRFKYIHGSWDMFEISNAEDWESIAIFSEWSELDSKLATITRFEITEPSDNGEGELKMSFAAPIETVFRNAVADKSNNAASCRLFTLTTPEGKIRVPTIHSAGVVWQARAMSAFLLQWLGKTLQTKTALKNKPLDLTSDRRDCFLYSADLSKSTDPISLPLARFVLNELVKAIGVKPPWWDDAMNNVIRRFVVKDEEERETTCGALMGLGPSWTILSILNAFAAHQAGASPTDHQTCGDDLIGLWTKDVINGYEANIKALGLESNKTKSYISKHYGVFCERFVTTKDRRHATGPDLVRIAEATGMKAGTRRCDRLLIDDLIVASRDNHNDRVIRRTCLRTAMALSPNYSTPGLLNQGGGGSNRPVDVKTLIGYILHGPISQVILDTDERVRMARAELRKRPVISGSGVPAEEVLTKLKAIICREELRQFTHGNHELKLRPFKDLRKAVALRRRSATAAIKRERNTITAVLIALASPDAYVKYSRRLYRDVTRCVRRRRYLAALKICKRSWQQHVMEETESSIIAQFAPIHQPQPDVLLRPSVDRRGSTSPTRK